MALFTGCSSKDEDSADLTTVRVGITKSFLGEAATFVAQQQGYFKDEGLDVQLEQNSSGAVSIRELFDEKIDIAHVAETPIMYALLDSSYYTRKEIPSFQIFADMIYADEIQHIIGRRDQGISNPRDISGKTVAISQGTQLDYFLDSFLLEHQIAKEELTLVDIDPQKQVNAIANGEVDVAVNWEPYATYIKQELGNKAISLDTKLTYSTLWLATARDRYAEENPEVLVQYLQALRQAQKYISKYPNKTQQLLAQRTGVSIAAIQESWDNIDYELSLNERLITLLDDQARWMERNNITDSSDINFRALVNFEPMQTVHPEGITVIQ
ncbi:ABC-type nitrate/sulfonate/bicarbonate transport system, substrate-binding protein [Fodinibius salinus]|uniref:ABC-type nitrate/sulfonate/bicarbonate transport system, substrate-binding protein n=1 Tax=Fodinibius salinus TaxID=860790 RepID=A0A5D3YMA6_9BACT|nr:ABC transporter substrate-binding protein [Fodinibius salinus]TYP94892.1 ABC-type nitrate/sulfonate/bicarbonate transport system, substrate-binding protein [Fodinibius salinus]